MIETLRIREFFPEGGGGFLLNQTKWFGNILDEIVEALRVREFFPEGGGGLILNHTK